MIDYLKEIWNFDHITLNKGRWISLAESEKFLEFIEGTEVYFESGTANGYSAVVASLVVPEVHTYDPVKRAHLWELQDIPTSNRITFHQKGFEDADLSGTSGKKKAIFIDGDHKDIAIIRDWNAIEKQLEKGDVVVFHDLHDNNLYKTALALADRSGYTLDLQKRIDRKQLFGVINC